MELDDNGDAVIEQEEQDKAEITLYAMVGNPSPNTMTEYFGCHQVGF